MPFRHHDYAMCYESDSAWDYDTPFSLTSQMLDPFLPSGLVWLGTQDDLGTCGPPIRKGGEPDVRLSPQYELTYYSPPPVSAGLAASDRNRNSA